MLDNIEANLIDANDYMEKAVVNLESAKKWHQKTRAVTNLTRCKYHISFIENVLHNDMLACTNGSAPLWGLQNSEVIESIVVK